MTAVHKIEDVYGFCLRHCHVHNNLRISE